jgi:hypothetical protein
MIFDLAQGDFSSPAAVGIRNFLWDHPIGNCTTTHYAMPYGSTSETDSAGLYSSLRTRGGYQRTVAAMSSHPHESDPSVHIIDLAAAAGGLTYGNRHRVMQQLLEDHIHALPETCCIVVTTNELQHQQWTEAGFLHCYTIKSLLPHNDSHILAAFCGCDYSEDKMQHIRRLDSRNPQGSHFLQPCSQEHVDGTFWHRCHGYGSFACTR